MLHERTHAWRVALSACVARACVRITHAHTTRTTHTSNISCTVSKQHLCVVFTKFQAYFQYNYSIMKIECSTSFPLISLFFLSSSGLPTFPSLPQFLPLSLPPFLLFPLFPLFPFLPLRYLRCVARVGESGSIQLCKVTLSYPSLFPLSSFSSCSPHPFTFPQSQPTSPILIPHQFTASLLLHSPFTNTLFHPSFLFPSFLLYVPFFSLTRTKNDLLMHRSYSWDRHCPTNPPIYSIRFSPFPTFSPSIPPIH